MIQNSKATKSHGHSKCMVSRRDFLLYSGAAGATSMIPLTLFAGTPSQTEVDARVVGYPRKLIAKVSELQLHKPMYFQYPDEESNSISMLVRTGIECGGGIGIDKDIVAYSMTCTHKGGSLSGAYKYEGEHRIVGQCPFHLSTFDLRRHGIMVSGQAFESLPQVLLEIEGDNVYAVGILGLIFGRTENLIDIQEV